MRGQTSNYYLTRSGGTLFELLEANTPPRRIISKLTKTVEVTRRRMKENPSTGQLYVEEYQVPSKRVMRQVYFSGGKPRGILKFSQRLMGELKLLIPNDTMIKLTTEQADRILYELKAGQA